MSHFRIKDPHLPLSDMITILTWAREQLLVPIEVLEGLHFMKGPRTCDEERHWDDVYAVAIGADEDYLYLWQHYFADDGDVTIRIPWAYVNYIDDLAQLYYKDSDVLCKKHKYLCCFGEDPLWDDILKKEVSG
jgi:hypothetical protein